MKTLILIFIFCLSVSASKAETIGIAGFVPANLQVPEDSILFDARSLAIKWISNASPILSKKGKFISEVAISRLQKSTIRRPIAPNNKAALFNCSRSGNDAIAMVLAPNPLDIYICPAGYSEISQRIKNVVKRLAQTMVHESWHLFEVYNSEAKSECDATDFEIAVVQENNGCIMYPSYSESCGFQVSVCR